MARVYVSSTFKDLKKCREKVRQSLRQLGHEDIAMEYYVAEDERPLDKCLKDVVSCELYLGIFAWRYGYVPAGQNKSITELEYLKAVEAEKKCLIFLLDEDAAWPMKFVDKGEDLEKIEALRNELSTRYIASFFKSADELIGLVGIAIHEWERENKNENPKVKQEIISHYNPSTLPDYPDTLKIFVTTNRAEELNSALKYLQNHRILLLTGVGGVGKTTIARALIDMKPDGLPMPFWFDFGQNQDANLENILEKLSSYMNCPDIARFREEKREPEKRDLDNLTDKLQSGNPVWLFFDNLETVLNGIYFHDEDLDLFFTCLHNSTHQAKIIITSRTFPKLKNGQDLVNAIEEEKQDVKGLKTNFAVDYLVKNGLDDLESDKLEELAKGVDGHPLALQLLVGLVKKFGVSDTLKNLTRYKRLKVDTIKIARKLFEKLAGNEKELLERISVYRQAETMNAIEIMFSDKTPIEAIGNLIDKSLLETDHKGKYWLHPLVQEFSYNDLGNQREAHLIAYNYYKSLNLPKSPTKKEDLQPAIEAHYHACEAEEYDLAADILWESNLHNLLDLWGYPRTLIEIYDRLLPKDHFKDGPILKDKQVHGVVLGNLGIAYRYLGDAKKAIEYHEQALKIDQEIDNRRNEGKHLGNLGNTYRDLGELKEAIECYEQALAITKEMNDRLNEENHLGNLGNTYRYLGDAKKAIEYYEKALKIAREIDERRGEGNWLGNLGNAYRYLGDPKKAIDYCDQALKIAREVGDRREEGNWLGNLGNAYRDLGDAKKAIEYYENALKIAREVGDRRREGIWLGNLGNIHRDLGNPKKSVDYCDLALKIARGVGDRRREGNWLGNLGNAYRYLGNPKKAIEYYENALKIAREIGDRRKEGIWLGNLGNMYRDLGNPKKSIDYCDQALKIAREVSDRRREGNWLGNLGNGYRYLGDPKKAIEYYEKALKIAGEVGDRRREGIWLGNLGNAYRYLGDPKKAIEYYKKALKIAGEVGDRRREGVWLGNLGNTNHCLGKTKKAIDYYEKALKIAGEVGDRRREGIWLGNLGNIYHFLGNSKKAIDYCDQALKITREVGDRRREGNWLGNLGLACCDMGDTKKAIDYYEKALKIAGEVGDRRREGVWLGNLGNAYRCLGETKKTIDYYKKALKIAGEVGDRRREGIWLGNLGLACCDMGVAKKAIEYCEQALIISREIGDRHSEGTQLGNLGNIYSYLGETKKAIEFLKGSLAIGKAIENLRIINFCEQKLKELDGL